MAVLAAVREWKPDAGKISLKNYVGFRIKHALKEYVRSRYRPGHVSLDAPTSTEEDAFTGHDTIGDAPSQWESVRAARVAEILDSLPERLGSVLRMRGEGNSLDQIAKRLQISKPRAQQLNDRALELVIREWSSWTERAA